MADELVKDQSMGRVASAVCAGTCAGPTDHTVMGSMDRVGSDEHVDWWHRYQVIMCQGCKTLSFREISGCSEDFEVGPDGWESSETVRLHPPRKAGSRGLGDDVSYLADPLAKLYDETRTSLVNGTPILTGIGLRALLDTICKEEKAVGKDLFHKINDLVEKRILVQSGADVLHQIRTLGNAAAHEAKPHSDAHLNLAMEVVDHLLQSVYILPVKMAKFSPAGGASVGAGSAVEVALLPAATAPIQAD